MQYRHSFSEMRSKVGICGRARPLSQSSSLARHQQHPCFQTSYNIQQDFGETRHFAGGGRLRCESGGGALLKVVGNVGGCDGILDTRLLLLMSDD